MRIKKIDSKEPKNLSILQSLELKLKGKVQKEKKQNDTRSNALETSKQKMINVKKLKFKDT